MEMLVPPLSVTVGGSKLQVEPSWTILLVAQVMTGAVVSMTLTVWLHEAELPQGTLKFVSIDELRDYLLNKE